MISSRCKECGAEKPLTEFYKSSRRTCKTCVCAKERRRQRTNPAVQEYDRMRGRSPHRKERVKANAHKYDRTHFTREWRSRNKEKYQAHVILNNALRAGKIAKPSSCEECRKPACVHGHHDDYKQHLSVRWLCTECHGAHHRELNERQRSRHD